MVWHLMIQVHAQKEEIKLNKTQWGHIDMMGSLIGGSGWGIHNKSDISRWDVNGIDYYSRDREIDKAYCHF